MWGPLVPTECRLLSQHLAPALLVDPERNEHRLRLDDPVEADLLKPRPRSDRDTPRPAGAGQSAGACSSRLLLIRLMVLAENVWPHSSSVTALTLRVDTPRTYISASALTKAFSDR